MMMNKYHQHSADTSSSSSSGFMRPGDVPHPRRPLCHSNPGSGEERSRTGELIVFDRPPTYSAETKHSPLQVEHRPETFLTIASPVSPVETLGKQTNKPMDYLSDGNKPHEKSWSGETDRLSTTCSLEPRSPSSTTTFYIRPGGDQYQHNASKSEDEMTYNSILMDRSGQVSISTAQKRYRSKNREFITDMQNIQAPNKSACRSRTRFKHQNSSPMISRSRTPHERRTSPYVSSDTSFLSTLAASRPNAATGLLGVASAALAAARAGTLTMGPNAIDEGPRMPYGGGSTMMEKRYSSAQHPTHTATFIPCHCQHQVCTYQEPHFFQPRSHEGVFAKRPSRRNSDSVLNVANQGSSSAVHVIMCSHCKPQQVDIPKVIQTGQCLHCPQGNCTCSYYDPFKSVDRKTSFSGLDPGRPYLHSSWVALSANECPEFSQLQPDTNRATSTAVLTALSTEFDPDASGYNDPDFYGSGNFQAYVGPSNLNYPPQTFNQKSLAERGRSISRDRRNQSQNTYYSGGYNRIKPRGLDAIGLDFMRINGARPGKKTVSCAET
ncbi:unnamed protein product [Echinostoma caproni]|uniref:Uncharacterized protein n=1 Tax=Echinostoma caproni TaxID=27848 RepID=A0A183ADK4_9TREM|nr:unnamed protein product [Echinostoma caproni]